MNILQKRFQHSKALLHLNPPILLPEVNRDGAEEKSLSSA